MKNILSNTQIFLFKIFIFLLPWQTIFIVQEVFYSSEKWHYGTIGIYISDSILISWLILSTHLYKKDLIAYISAHKKLFISAFFLCAWSFLSIIWSQNESIAFYFSIKLTVCIYIFFILQVVKLNVKNIIFIFLVSMLCQSIIGLYQFITQDTFAYTLLGLQYHDIWHGGTATVTAQNERWLRVYGGFPHPNIFGGILISTLLLNTWLYITTKKYSIPFIIFSFFCTALFTLNIILTFSRTTWLIMCITLCFFTGVVLWKGSIQQKKNIIKVLSIIFITSLLLITIFWNIFSARKESTKFTHNSFSDRKIYLTHAQNIIKERPFFGTGIGNYTNTVAKEDQNKKPIWYYQPVHNSFILIFAEIGFIGSVAFFCFIFFALQTIWVDLKKFIFIKWIISLIIFSFFLISFFDHWPWTSHIGLLTFFIFLGLLSKKEKSDNA